MPLCSSASSLLSKEEREESNNLSRLIQKKLNDGNGEVLELCDAGIGDLGVRVVVHKLLQNEQSIITRLGLSFNRIGNEGCAALGDFLRFNNSLESLNLYGNIIGHEGVRMIASGLLRNTSIVYLSLSNNQIGSEGCHALARVIEANTPLKGLELLGNIIESKGANIIADAIEKNTNITSLNVSCNNIENEEGKKATNKINFFSSLNKCGHHDVFEASACDSITCEKWVEKVIHFCERVSRRYPHYHASCLFYCIHLKPGAFECNVNENEIIHTTIQTETKTRPKKRQKK